MATTVKQYLDGLDPQRRPVIEAVRTIVNKHLPEGYAESFAHGMIVWAVPLSRYPDTYNGEPLCYAALAAQKNYNSLYLMGAYMDADARKALESSFRERGLRIDMGKSCLRFKSLDDLPLDVIGKAIRAMPMKRFIAAYEAVRKK